MRCAVDFLVLLALTAGLFGFVLYAVVEMALRPVGAAGL
jgi:hypothetical protein